ncbi:hypothetical protein V8D89_008551 [Ganoderma adspersum]
MASLFIRTENKPRSLQPNPALASADSMPPQVIALICASVLIFLVFLSSAIILIHRRHLHHRTQDTTQVEAQVQLPGPVASQSEEKVENVSPSPSGSSKSYAAAPLLSTATTPLSGSLAVVEKPIEKLMAKTSAALSKVDKYTTLPLRRARQARQAKNAQKNVVFDFSTPLATLDAEIVSSENSAPSRRVSHQFSSMRSTSLTSGPSTSSPAPPHSELLPYSTVPASNSGQSALRPSPTVVSMEVRPVEADAAALPDTGTMLVSGSFPSFSSCSSVISLSSICESTDDGHTSSEAEPSKYSYAILDCETPRRMEHHSDAEKGTPYSSTTSLSTMTTRRDSSFSSDADTVCEVGPGKASLTVKAVKLDDRLSFPVSVSDLSLRLSSDKGDDVFGSRPSSGPDDLTSLTQYSDGTKLSEDGSLTTLASADTSF